MSSDKNKYLEDEQVKKNLDSFKNDRENFLKNNGGSDNLSLSFNRTDSVEELSDNNPDDSNDIKVNKDDKKKKGSIHIGVPIILTLLSIIIFYLYFLFKIGFFETLNINNSNFLQELFFSIMISFNYFVFNRIIIVPFFISLFIWNIYFIWLIIKLKRKK